MGTKDGVPAAGKDRARTVDAVESGQPLAWDALQARSRELRELEKLARAAGSSTVVEKPTDPQGTLPAVAEVHRLSPRGGRDPNAARAYS